MSSETNKEDGLKSLQIAQRKFADGDIAGAIKFTKKSLRLYETTEAHKLLDILQSQNPDESTNASSNGASASYSGSQSHGNASGKSSNVDTEHPSEARRRTEKGSSKDVPNEKREYTDHQMRVVQRVISCKKTEYYKILDLPKTCEEIHIRKSYKKLALHLHPDKNTAPGADEAFKMVSKAFTVLSDAKLRRIFDQTGSDPESRSAGSSSPADFGFGSRYSNTAYSAGRGPTMDDLFGDFGGSPFGEFFFNFGPGVHFTSTGQMPRFHTFQRPTAGAQARARQQQQQQAMPENTILRFAPVILLILFAFISSLGSFFFPGTPPYPKYSFTPSKAYDTMRSTTNYNVNYYVNPENFASNAMYKDYIKRNPAKEFQPSRHVAKGSTKYHEQLSKHISKLPHDRAFAKFESDVDSSYYSYLQDRCEDALSERRQEILRSSGIFGWGADEDRIKQLKRQRYSSCDKLISVFNVVIPNYR